MTAALLFLALHGPQGGVPQGTAQAEPAPKVLLATMLRRYADSPGIQGSVAFRQSAAGQTVAIDTEFAISKPDKLFIAQSDSRRPGFRYLVTCDGEEFSYDTPKKLQEGALTAPDKRLVETFVKNGARIALFEPFLAAKDSLPDPFNPVPPIVLGWNGGVKNFMYQLVTLVDEGHEVVGGRDCRVIAGKWRASAVTIPSGTFRMFVTPAGDFVKFRTEESFAFSTKGEPASKPVSIVTEWSANIEIDVVLDKKLFRVIR